MSRENGWQSGQATPIRLVPFKFVKKHNEMRRVNLSGRVLNFTPLHLLADKRIDGLTRQTIFFCILFLFSTLVLVQKKC
jgi:hypothetical protein